jgi:UDP-2-acetamido-2,6-beta-L-arabino-hexul-4-ose reductase
MSGIRILQLESHAWEDERGWGLRPLEAAGLAGRPLGDLHVVSLVPGGVRRNHFHDGTEWLLVLSGEVEIRSRAGDGDGVQVQTLGGSPPVLLEIPPGIRHSIKNVGGQTLHLVAFSDREKLATTAETP